MICILFIVAGNLVVNVLARTTRFVSEMGKARTGLRRFRRETKVVAATLGRLSGLFGIGLGARAVTGFLTNQAQIVDALGKTATRLGMSTEALQEYQFAAKQSGVQTRTLNMAIQRMTRRIGEFAIGTGEARDTLQGLGFDADRLVRLKPEQQFEMMLNVLRGIGDENERLRVAFKLFDSEGVAVLQMAENLSRARREFQSLGLAIKETDVRQVEALTDELGKTSETLAALGRDVLVEITPELKVWLRGARDLLQEARRSRLSPEDRRRADLLGLDPDDPRLSRTVRIGEIMGATDRFGGAAPVERSLRESERLEAERKALIANNPRMLAAEAEFQSRQLEMIQQNTRPAQTQRDGT